MPLISSIIFYGFAIVMVATALMVVTSRNVFHSAMALTVVLAVVAGLFALLGADFLAAAQLLVYVGGIMIIMLFVVMLSQQPADTMQSQTNDQWVAGLLFASAVVTALVVKFADFFKGYSGHRVPVPTSATLGRLLLGDMVVPFEAVSLVLLAALVGAVIFAQNREDGSSQ